MHFLCPATSSSTEPYTPITHRPRSPPVRHLHEIGPGTLRGTLYHLGRYPGVIIHPNRTDEVQGTIFAIPDTPAMLEALDTYENYRPSDPESSLFLRQAHLVTRPDGSTLDCWVYLYNRRL